MSQLESDDDFIVEGDVVEHIMNTNVFGVVVGVSGSLVYLRISPSLATLAFHGWELRKVDSDEYVEPDPGAEADTDNIIDFTKARDLRAAKTRGAA